MVNFRTRVGQILAEPITEHLGESAAKAFAALKVETVGDLMRYIPRDYMDGTQCTDLSSLTVGEQVAVLARVEQTTHWDSYRQEVPLAVDLSGKSGFDKQRHRLEAVITDGAGRLKLTFFGQPRFVAFWRRNLLKGTRGIFAGKVSEFRNELQMTHPQFVMLDGNGAIVGHSDEKKQNMVSIAQSDLVSIYPATAKLPTWTIAACAQQVIETLPEDDLLPEEVRGKAGVLPLAEAFAAIHLPTTRSRAAAGVRRLIFDEAFGTQLTMAYRRADAGRREAIPRPGNETGLVAELKSRLPFQLTDGQVAAIAEIGGELASPRPMNRLLQGEVGSGKTLVALLAMLQVVDADGQAVLFAPTEVLAAQHYETILRLLGEIATRPAFANEPSVTVVLLTGSMTAVAKKNAMLKIASGAADIVIGTHALLSDRVQFADLGLVVVDEQHRFGVAQRSTLVGKADSRPHLLVMTATPIPRSVAMTMFGDLEVSSLRELPAGRKPVATTVVDTQARPDWVTRAWQRIREEVSLGRQVFIVAPRIMAESKSGLDDTGRRRDGCDTGRDSTNALPAGAEAWAEWLAAGPLSGLRIGLLHGSLPPVKQREVMSAVVDGQIDVLVATTIIEVGVDVPNATMMIITDADRFGVSQLHQLRGRVGRGSEPGVCLLFTSAEPGTTARERLAAVAQTMDGFVLADIDLAQRKEGDILGGGQAGNRSSLRLLRVLDHSDLIEQAFDLAVECVAADSQCTHPGLHDYVVTTEALASGDWGEAG